MAEFGGTSKMRGLRFPPRLIRFWIVAGRQVGLVKSAAELVRKDRIRCRLFCLDQLTMISSLLAFRQV